MTYHIVSQEEAQHIVSMKQDPDAFDHITSEEAIVQVYEGAAEEVFIAYSNGWITEGSLHPPKPWQRCIYQQNTPHMADECVYVNAVGQAVAKFAHSIAERLGRGLGRITKRKER